MRAVVFHDVGDFRLKDIPEPRIKAKADAIVRITASAKLKRAGRIFQRQPEWVKVEVQPT